MMTREEYIKICSVCTNRSFNPKQGIICGLTDKPADFNGNCADYDEDPDEVRHEELKVHNNKKINNRGINRGRIALFVIAGLYIIVGIYESFIMPGSQLLYGIIDWVLALAFVGLGIWSYKKASLPMIIGLCLYVALILLLAVVDPITIVKGIIWKVLIIAWLVFGISAARRDEAKQKKIQPSGGDLLDQL